MIRPAAAPPLNSSATRYQLTVRYSLLSSWRQTGVVVVVVVVVAVAVAVAVAVVVVVLPASICVPGSVMDC